MKIDFKKRLTNKTWWIAVISVVLLIAQYFGFDLTNYIGQDWQTLVTLIFALIALLGITVDTSTDGISDKAIENAQEVIKAINTVNKARTESTTTSINNKVNQNSDDR